VLRRARLLGLGRLRHRQGRRASMPEPAIGFPLRHSCAPQAAGLPRLCRLWLLPHPGPARCGQRRCQHQIVTAAC